MNGDSQELILERYKLYILAFFLPKIVPKERGYCEKQTRIIYLNMARTYNSVTFVCLFVYKTLEIVDLLKYSGLAIFGGRRLK